MEEASTSGDTNLPNYSNLKTNEGGAGGGGAGGGGGADSLLHLLDGVILLYHIGGHKQLGKVAAQRDAMKENITLIAEIDKKIAYCKEKDSNPALLMELKSSRQVFVTRLDQQARLEAFLLAAIHSDGKFAQITKLMRMILETLKAASKEGELFAFVPDYYVDSLTELCTALRLYFKVPKAEEEATKKLLIDVGEFLAVHFCDSRIIYADSKDILLQALAGFVCHPPTLEALEHMPSESRRKMVLSLLQPYENRAWAQNNWILVRVWKGCGFGFRYTKSPHLNNRFGPKPPHADGSNFTQATAPCPSLVLQLEVMEVLVGCAHIATPFLNSLLNQLNWAFSEFIGMLQEIQNASNRPERVFIDARQLRICATCFDLTLALLRVLEMLSAVAPQLFTDLTRPNAEFLLSRLCQLLCQVLNRVSGCTGCFGHVVTLEIPGLETIHYFPILTAVAGILSSLLSREMEQETKKQVATKILLSEPSFQINSIHQLLGGGGGGGGGGGDSSSSSSPPSSSSCAKFSLRNYPQDITPEEIRLIERVTSHLETAARRSIERSSSEEEENLCTICYAYKASAVFKPCGHTSCRACVTQHLMNRNDCFFCKSPIEEVMQEGAETSLKQDKQNNG